jgi:DNA-binding MarR family transcriptional regulator
MIMWQQYHSADMVQAMNQPVTEAIGAAARRECVVAAGHPIPLGAEERTALLLARLGAVLTEVADDRLAGAGLSGRDYSVLAILSADGPDSQFELATLLGKAPGVVVAAVDSLEREGLVARTRDPSDRRRTRVTLSDAGRDALERADVLAEQTVADVLRGLDDGERAQLQALLVKGLR